MKPKELFELNGDFVNSPLIATVRNMHKIFCRLQVDYAVVGGVAVARCGSTRTTHDVDILTTSAGWSHIRRQQPDSLETRIDSALDLKTGVEIELAAKDLADLVDLIRSNCEMITAPFINRLHAGVREEVRRISEKVISR